MDDLDLVVKAQDKEFWDKVYEELKPSIKRALEETFGHTKCTNEFVKEEKHIINYWPMAITDKGEILNEEYLKEER